MGIVFDEVIGRVESDEAPPRQGAPSEPAVVPTPEPQEPLDQLLRRLQRREARLRAD